MEHISTMFYLILASIGLLFGGFHWLYKKEIRRMEQQVGITIPAHVLQLITALLYGSLILALFSLLMLGISFMSN